MIMLDILKEILAENQIEINENQLKRIDAYYELLMEKNRVMDLTNITEPREVALRHMADSLFLVKCADLKGKKLIDIGTGAGFPGMPLLMYDETLDITMVDSTGKRIDFINDSMGKIGDCNKAIAITARAEDLGIDKKHREKYDFVTSRAVAPMNILAELTLPLLKVGGRFLAMKSANEEGEKELNDALFAIKTLGGKVVKTIDYQLASDCPKRRIVIVEKVKPTADAYPRKYAKIKAKPLGSK